MFNGLTKDSSSENLLKIKKTQLHDFLAEIQQAHVSFPEIVGD